MHKILAVTATIVFVPALVAFRLLFGASQVAAGSALGRFRTPKGWQRWLFGEHDHPTVSRRS